MFCSFRFCSSIGKLSKNFGWNFHRKEIDRQFSQKIIDVNTNVVKDVILYKSENDRLLKILNVFGLFQFGLWSYVSLTAFKTLKNVPGGELDEDAVWWKKINLGESKYRNGLTIITFALGWSILTLTWAFTLRSVKYIILRRGGQQATIVTYTPFSKNRLLTLDLNNISAKETRAAAKSFLPLKVKDYYFHYLVDMKGEFKNPLLFDNTVGLKRVWKK
ncbi:transmembrane protein 223 [Sitophilus oryzae]|uniref:Transmembrane protein 223 n=1 Tax=Sitophilus oryzae TaxID=7048 RepID=A0A6J2XXB6_SITOR|nr:transmembrane protein 223 [Sitophilus oryzae]